MWANKTERTDWFFAILGSPLALLFVVEPIANWAYVHE
jgi:hypothetical protein